jgi:formylglycine-generating enzyme required for sulfatase activity
MGKLPYLLRSENINWPVTDVNWHEAMAFCEKLNEMFKEDLPDEYRFRLPTEAQWEYACRAGTQSVYHSGNTLRDLDRVAWHKKNSGGHPHPVGEKDPNNWGFHDMHGNVVEWCWDDFYPYPRSATVDLVSIECMTTQIRLKIVRGGAWNGDPTDGSFRCSCRLALMPEDKKHFAGFRVSLRIPEEAKMQTSDPNL